MATPRKPKKPKKINEDLKQLSRFVVAQKPKGNPNKPQWKSVPVGPKNFGYHDTHLGQAALQRHSNLKTLQRYIDEGKITSQSQVDFERSKIQTPFEQLRKSLEFEAKVRQEKADAEKVKLSQDAPNLFDKIVKNTHLNRVFTPENKDSIKGIGGAVKDGVGSVGDAFDAITPDAVTDPLGKGIKKGVSAVFDTISRPLYGVQNTRKELNNIDDPKDNSRWDRFLDSPFMKYANAGPRMLNGGKDPFSFVDDIIKRPPTDPRNLSSTFDGEKVSDLISAFGRGVSGKEKTTGMDVVADVASKDGNTDLFDNKYFQAATGLTSDFAFDPLSYIGVGVARNAASGVTKAAEVRKMAGKERDLRQVATNVDAHADSLLAQSNAKAEELDWAQKHLEWQEGRDEVVNNTASKTLIDREIKRRRLRGQPIDELEDFENVLEVGNTRKAISSYNTRQARTNTVGGYRKYLSQVKKDNDGEIPGWAAKSEEEWLSGSPDLKTSLGSNWSNHPVLKDHDPDEFFEGVKRTLWRDNTDYRKYSETLDEADALLLGPKKKQMVDSDIKSPSGGTTFKEKVSNDTRDREKGLYAKQQDLRDAVKTDPSKKPELDKVTASIAKAKKDKALALEKRQDYEAVAFNRAAQDLVDNKRNFRDPELADHLIRLQGEISTRLAPKKSVLEGSEVNELGGPRKRVLPKNASAAKQVIEKEMKAENVLRKEQGLPPLTYDEIVDSRFTRDATDEVRLKNEGEDYLGQSTPQNPEGTVKSSELDSNIKGNAFQAETARVKGEEFKPGFKKKRTELPLHRGTGKVQPNNADELVSDGKRVTDPNFIDLGKPGSDFDEILRDKNLEAVQAAIDKRLKDITTPVGRLEKEKIEVPSTFLDESGVLDKNKLFGDPETKPFLMIDPKNERAFVRKENIAHHLGREATDSEVKFLQHLADEANISGAGKESYRRIRPVGAKTNPVGLGGVTRKTYPRIDAIRDSLRYAVNNIDEVSTLKGQSLRLSTGGNLKKTAAAIKTKATEDMRTEAQKALDAVEEAKISGSKDEVIAAKERVDSLRKEHIAIQKELDEYVKEADTVGKKVNGIITEQSKIQQILRGEHAGDRVGLTLRILGQNVSSGMTTARVIAAGKHINDLPVINGISKPYKKLFQPMSSMAYPLRALRSKGLNTTSFILRGHYDDLQSKMGSIPDKELKSALSSYRAFGVSNETTQMLDDELNYLVKYFDGSKTINDEVFDYKSDIGKFLDETLTMTNKDWLLFKNDPTPQTLLDAMGTSLHEKKIYHTQALKNAGKKPDKVKNPKEYSRWMKQTEESRRILSLSTPSNPYDLIWKTRIAVEQAEGYRRFKDEINSLFGIKIASDLIGNKKHRSNAANDAVIQGLKKKGWKTVDGLGNDHIYPPEIHADIERLSKIFDPTEVGSVMKQFDKITGMWKVGATLYNPGYYERNLVGEMISGYLGGVTNPKYYGMSMQMTRYRNGEKGHSPHLMKHDVYASKVRENIPDATKVLVTRPDGTKVTVADLEALYQENGNYTSFLNTELTEQKMRGSSLKTNKLTAAPKWAHNKVKNFGERGENFPRKAHFIYSFENAPRHMSVKEAAEYATDQVRKYHFDYSDVTDFEKMVMMRAFPFYKWTRKAVPLMTEMLFMQPAKMNSYPKVMNAISSGSLNEDDLEAKQGANVGLAPFYDENVPSHIRNQQAYPIGRDAEGKMTYARQGTPQFDALGAAFGLQDTANLMVNPFLKIPFEQARGQGVNTYDKRFNGPNYQLGDRLTSAANSLPATKLIAKIANRKDSALTEKGAMMDETLASFLSGVTLTEELPEYVKYDSIKDYLKSNPDKQSESYKNYLKMEEFVDDKTGQIDFDNYYKKYPELKTPGIIAYEAEQKKYSVGKDGFNLRQWILDHPEEYPDGWNSNSLGIVPKKKQYKPQYKFTNFLKEAGL